MVRVVGIDHLVIRVSDYEKSKAFYGRLFEFLGFEISDEYDDAIGWTNGKTRFWIGPADAEGRKHKYRVGDVGFHHYAFQLRSRKDVDALQAFLQELGATIVDPAGEYYDDYYAVFFLDPDGLKLEGMKYGERHAREARRKRSDAMKSAPRSFYARLPFFYGWVIVAVVFVTMGVAVNARTAFSLLFPPILDEFGWERGTTAGAFSFGFIVSAIMSPSLGRLMDRRGPLVVNELGVVLIGSGLLLATLVQQPWQLYATLGMLVGGGSVCLGYTGQGLFLPNWFVRRRGLAMSLAFSGVGVGSVILLPWLQSMIARTGWRSACLALGIVVLVLLLPLNLLVRRRPEDIGLAPDGDGSSHVAVAGAGDRERRGPGLGRGGLDARRAMRTSRFWWIAVGYFCALFAWYAVQVHQTKYLVEIGFTRHSLPGRWAA